MVAEDLARALAEAKPVFRKKWSILIDQRGYGFEVAKFDSDVRKRHMALWDQLIRALRTGRYDDYLTLLEKEGRLQARGSTRIEAVVGQMSTMMNMMWDIISNTSMVEINPTLLKPITERFNTLRSRA